jgi:hypothetical protein
MQVRDAHAGDKSKKEMMFSPRPNCRDDRFDKGTGSIRTPGLQRTCRELLTALRRLLRGSQGPPLKVVDQDVHTNQEYP